MTRRKASYGSNGELFGIVDFIKNVGFPIAVAAFLLWRVDASIAELNTTLGELRDAILMEKCSADYQGRF